MAIVRLVGLAIPFGTVLVLNSALDRPGDGPRGSANLGLVAVLILAAFAGAVLFRSCSSVILIPLGMVVTAQLHRATTYPDCNSWTYDRGLGGAILGAVILMVPLVIATVIGTAAGMAWFENRRRPPL